MYIPEKECIGVYTDAHLWVHMFALTLFEVLDVWRNIHPCLCFRKTPEIAQLKAL